MQINNEHTPINLSELEQQGIVAENASLVLLKSNIKRIKEDRNVYYNENRDQHLKKKYYHKVNMNVPANSLFSNLHIHIKKSHKNLLPYFLSKDIYLYTWVDLQPDGTIESIYSGKKHAPHKFLHEDFYIIEERYKKFQALIKSKLDHYETLKKIKSIDSEHKFNTEHIVPQSWFNAAEPMKGDLHHLFVCQPECNTLRSNYPYGEHVFYNANMNHDQIQNDCGIVCGEYFEPKNGKGTVARAMFYFLVRYPEVIKKSLLKKVNFPVLLKWNRDFPVTIYEKHRNLAIYEIQGNRNPFIDFPNLADRIWLEK